MVNPDKNICRDGGCVNKLKWDSDGSNFDNWAYTSHSIKADGGRDCFRYTNTAMDDRVCYVNHSYICEFQCPVSAVTTTTAPPGSLFKHGNILSANLSYNIHFLFSEKYKVIPRVASALKSYLNQSYTGGVIARPLFRIG